MPGQKNGMKGSGKTWKAPDSRFLDQLYDRGYYHGQTSGYPEAGYRQGHPNWDHWIDLIAAVKPGGTLIDLGCAYGYLVEEARRRGYVAAGLDVSSYALAQEPRLAPWLVRAELTRLPIADEAVDVAAAFDVLEHLTDPLSALRETARVLKPDGLLVGTTPDPLRFSRPESTHFHDRPPSFWISALEELGMEVRFRFSEEPYNFQFLAAFKTSETASRLDILQHDYIDARPDFVRCRGALRAVPRNGWGPLQHGGRPIAERDAAIYLLNPTPRPLRLEISFRVRNSPDFSTLRVRLDSLVLAEIFLDSESAEHAVGGAETFLSAGGHHLFFETRPGGPRVEVSRVEISSSRAAGEETTRALPFDLYQRYRTAGRIAALLGPKSILDVGGLLGDEDGHLAASADFLASGQPPETVVVSTDLRQADIPSHAPAEAWDQPYEDGSFEMVVSLDVLEHLPPDRRTSYLRELDRVASRWTVLGAPTADPQVEAAEERLAETLMSTRRFLQEHRRLGLPDASEVERFYHRLGRRVYSLPNGFLPRWTAMQALTQHYFSLRDSGALTTLNRLYNEIWHPLDQVEPSYRRIWLICRDPLSAEEEAAFEALRSPGADAEQPLEWEIFQRPEALHALQRLLDAGERREEAMRNVQFLVNERQKLIGLLQREVEDLRSELENTPLWKLGRRRLQKKYGN